MKKSNKPLKHQPYLRFKLFLLENRIKQKEVAKLLNVSHVTVSQKINGTLDFSFSEVEKICQHYGIELDIFSTKKLRNSNTKLA